MAMFAATGTNDLLLRPTVDVIGRLGLAAAPTFALMAWVSAAGSPDMAMCSVASAFVPINDMALMYLLMSLFHLSPWLKRLPVRSRHRNTPIIETEGD